MIVPGALSALTPDHVDAFAAQIAAADVLLVQLEIPLDDRAARARGRPRRRCPPILNPAPAPAEPITPAAAYLTPNESEAPAVADDAEGTLVVGRWATKGPGSRRRTIPAFPVDAVDTTGAGDAFSQPSRSRWPRAATDLEAVRGAARRARTCIERPGVIHRRLPRAGSSSSGSA